MLERELLEDRAHDRESRRGNGTIKLGAFNDNFTTITTNKYFNSDALVVNTLLDEEGQVYNGNGIVQYESGKLVGYIFRNNIFVKVFEKLVYDQSDCIYQGGGAGCHITTKLNEADIDGDGIANILLTIDREDASAVKSVVVTVIVSLHSFPAPT